MFWRGLAWQVQRFVRKENAAWQVQCLEFQLNSYHNKIMSREDFLFLLETARYFEFECDGQKYVVKVEKDDGGQMKYLFGIEYEKAFVFNSFTHLMAEGRCGNHYLKDVIYDLKKS